MHKLRRCRPHRAAGHASARRSRRACGARRRDPRRTRPRDAGRRSADRGRHRPATRRRQRRRRRRARRGARHASRRRRCSSPSRTGRTATPFATSISARAAGRDRRADRRRRLRRARAAAFASPGWSTVRARSRSPARPAPRRNASAPMSRRRAQFSLYSNFSVGENLLVRLGQPEIAGFGPGAEDEADARRSPSERSGASLVKTRAVTQGIRSLSGGNQQKVAIAQALNCVSRGCCCWRSRRAASTSRANGEIYRLLRDFAEAGNVVIMFCTEVLEDLRSGRLRARGRRRPPFAADLGSRLRSRRKPRDGHHANAAASSRVSRVDSAFPGMRNASCSPKASA